MTIKLSEVKPEPNQRIVELLEQHQVVREVLDL